jgi:hypothetical protein
MFHSGGKSLEDIRTITSDKALREILRIPKIPTADATGKWLKRHGLKGIYGIEKINQKLLGRYLGRINEHLTLDIDATIMQSHKSTAQNTYKMFPGFSPIPTSSLKPPKLPIQGLHSFLEQSTCTTSSHSSSHPSPFSHIVVLTTLPARWVMPRAS